MCEVNFCFEALCDELVAGKLASVVGDDAMDVSYERCHHGYDGSCKSLGILSLWQFPHEQIVFASLNEGDDGSCSSAVFSDDGVHFPVSESVAVGLWVSLIYHYSVLDSRVGYGMASFDLLELVPTTLEKFSSTRTVEADITVNGFDADARFSIVQHPPSDLIGRPLLVDHQCEDLLSHVNTELARFTHPPLAFIALLLGNTVMVMVSPLVTSLTRGKQSAVMHVYRISNVFYRYVLFE